MFDFRIIKCTDGTQIIDSSLKTPYDALTPLQLVEYTEVDREMAFIDRMKKKKQREEEYKQKLSRNPLYKLARFCGLYIA